MHAYRMRAVTVRSDAGKEYASVAKVLAVAIAAGYASSAAACWEGYTCFTAPAAIVQAASNRPVVRDGYLDGDHEVAFGFDGQDLAQLPEAKPRMAMTNTSGASAKAETDGTKYGAFAITSTPTTPYGGGGPNDSATAEAHFLFIPHDTELRGLVPLTLKLKMSAEAAGTGSARYSVVVCQVGEDGYLSYDASGKIVYIASPRCGWDAPYGYEGSVAAGTWHRQRWIQRNLQLDQYGSGSTVSDALNTSVSVVPGIMYQMSVYASSSSFGTNTQDGTGLAAIDPVLEPVDAHVSIEYPNLAENPNAQPIMGNLTPADLQAMGLDPQPFVDFGFFAPPSNVPPSDPPPPPPPANKYWCGPGFWLNNATEFGGSAWPASAPPYYDYNSTAGQLTGCPAATGNPTLLQALQSPKLYFSRLMGAGFNCVGDYLSAKSGLTGTMADNNGVCSIDQLGHHVE